MLVYSRFQPVFEQLRTLLQPGSPAEQSTLYYLHQQKNNVA